MLITLLATAVVLGVLIFVHELGHFMTAKLVDIEVPRFSIGFGPKVIGFRRGETEYVLSLLPLGGYVKMAGMEEMEAIEGGAEEKGASGRQVLPDGTRAAAPRDFESKSLPARTLVISAGVIMNLLFAFILFAFIAMVWGIPAEPESVVGGVVEEFLAEGTEALASVQPGSRITALGSESITTFEDLRIAIATARSGPTDIRFENGETVAIDLPSRDSLKLLLLSAIEPVERSEARIREVLDDGAAARAGLQPEDRVVRAGGTPVSTWQEFVTVIEAHPGQPVPLVVERDDELVELTVTPEPHTLANGHAYGRIGVSRPRAVIATPREHVGPSAAVIYGATETWRWMELTVDFLAGVIGGRMSARGVGGPITIGQISGDAARAGMETFLNFMALLSVNLAILNLLPIPVLDGGHLVFLAVEAIRGRALSLKQRMRLSQVGFVIILAIMAFAIGNDLLRVIGL